MTISANIIADSISPEGIRLTTMQLRYPRFIHAEFMTHRMFSRNASSSRAIPVARMIEDLRRDPAMPVYWGSHQAGMQAGEELNEDDQWHCSEVWFAARDNAISAAKAMIDAGLHKQIANRILEPWAHINVVVTATDWANFFALRAHPDAQPEIKALALEMLNAMAGSQPIHLNPGEWHLPYISAQDWSAVRGYFTTKNPNEEPTHDNLRDTLLPVSVARCARVSYLTHDGRQTSIEEDIALYDRLVGSQPLHASPAEHQATPDVQRTVNDNGFYHQEWDNPHQWGNFRGWIQYRKTLAGENVPG
jgi:thymidylate synthase ThyX